MNIFCSIVLNSFNVKVSNPILAILPKQNCQMHTLLALHLHSCVVCSPLPGWQGSTAHPLHMLFSAVQHFDSTLLFDLPLNCAAEDCCCLPLLCCSAGLCCCCLALPYAAYALLCSWLAPYTSSNVNAPPPARLPSTLQTLSCL